MNLRKVLCVAFACCFILVGCGQSNTTSDGSNTNSGTQISSNDSSTNSSSQQTEGTNNNSTANNNGGNAGGNTGGGPGGNTGGGPRGGGINKDNDAQLQNLISTYVSSFSQHEYSDDVSGLSISYNLFLPQNYDSNTNYPLVVFIADSSTVGKETTAPLTQGYGALVWAIDEWQNDNPCIILVPQYSEVVLDDHNGFVATEYVEATKRLIDNISSNYSVDTSRIYGTGQSMGCMTTLVLASRYPDLYNTCMFVDGQWDITTLEPLKNQRFVYFAAEGDTKAFTGMQEVIGMLEQNGVSMGRTQLNARWTEEQINSGASELFSAGNNINFITWEAGSVLPEDRQGGMEHMYSFDPAYKVAAAREWVFNQN